MEGLASHVSESILRIGLNAYWPRRFCFRVPGTPRYESCLDSGGVHLLTGVASMIRKEYEYRRNAIVSVELARRTASPADKAHLLKLAEAWLDLAKRARAQSGHQVRKVGEHPIAKLGDRDQRAA